MHQRKKERRRQNWFDQLGVSVSPLEETVVGVVISMRSLNFGIFELARSTSHPAAASPDLVGSQQSPDAGEVGMSFTISESNWTCQSRETFQKIRFIQWRWLRLWVFTPRACLSSPESVSESLELFPSCFSSFHIQKHLTAKMHHKHKTLQVLGTYLSCRREKI